MLGELSIPNTVNTQNTPSTRNTPNISNTQTTPSIPSALTTPGVRNTANPSGVVRFTKALGGGRGKRTAVVSAALAVGLFAGGAGAALAAGWHTIPRLKSSGALFSSGTYRFNPKGTEHGGFEFKGKLKDTDSGDGHNVYVEVRVEGYDWNRFYGKQTKTVSLHKVVYDAAALYTSDATIRVCRDRGTLHPDNCASAPHYKR